MRENERENVRENVREKVREKVREQVREKVREKVCEKVREIFGRAQPRRNSWFFFSRQQGRLRFSRLCAHTFHALNGLFSRTSWPNVFGHSTIAPLPGPILCTYLPPLLPSRDPPLLPPHTLFTSLPAAQYDSGMRSPDIDSSQLQHKLFHQRKVLSPRATAFRLIPEHHTYGRNKPRIYATLAAARASPPAPPHPQPRAETQKALSMRHIPPPRRLSCCFPTHDRATHKRIQTRHKPKKHKAKTTTHSNTRKRQQINTHSETETRQHKAISKQQFKRTDLNKHTNATIHQQKHQHMHRL